MAEHASVTLLTLGHQGISSSVGMNTRVVSKSNHSEQSRTPPPLQISCHHSWTTFPQVSATAAYSFTLDLSINRWGHNQFPPFFPCSPLPSGTWQTPGLSIRRYCLPTSSSVCRVFCLPQSLKKWQTGRRAGTGYNLTHCDRHERIAGQQLLFGELGLATVTAMKGEQSSSCCLAYVGDLLQRPPTVHSSSAMTGCVYRRIFWTFSGMFWGGGRGV